MMLRKTKSSLYRKMMSAEMAWYVYSSEKSRSKWKEDWFKWHATLLYCLTIFVYKCVTFHETGFTLRL
jgi:hypothetical protein